MANSLLARNKLFDGIAPNVYGRIIDGSIFRKFRRGDTIWAEGASERKLYLLLSGEVSFQSADAERHRQFKATANPEDFLGELTLLGLDVQPISAIAATECDVLVLDAATIDELLSAAPVEIMRNLSRGAIERLRSCSRESLQDIARVLSSLVHDLKQPIATAKGARELIAQDPGKHIAKFLPVIERSMGRMLDLVQDILGAVNGKVVIDPTEVAIGDLMDVVEELALGPLRSQKITVITEVDYRGTITCDWNKIARALANIIKNAGEAMKGEGTLTLKCAAVDEKLVFTISDTGPGIHPSVLGGLFDALVSHGKAGGSGLGMTITKTIAEAHGGSVGVKSSPEGTTFKVVLPLRGSPTP